MCLIRPLPVIQNPTKVLDRDFGLQTHHNASVKISLEHLLSSLRRRATPATKRIHNRNYSTWISLCRSVYLCLTSVYGHIISTVKHPKQAGTFFATALVKKKVLTVSSCFSRLPKSILHPSGWHLSLDHEARCSFLHVLNPRIWMDSVIFPDQTGRGHEGERALNSVREPTLGTQKVIGSIGSISN